MLKGSLKLSAVGIFHIIHIIILKLLKFSLDLLKNCEASLELLCLIKILMNSSDPRIDTTYL